mgnify:CR=1 FL=1
MATLLAAGALRAADTDGAWPASVERLRSYLRLDTSNPPGNELRGALFLKELLEREGIETEIFEPEPGRANLYARLRGSGKQPGLLLHHHIDVVPAPPAGWQKPPFAAGFVGENVLVGRGTLDTKGLGMAQLEAFLDLKRRGRPLVRDVVYLATADEETGGRLEIRLTETNIGYEETIKHIGIKMGPHLHLIVKDEGVGMESSVLERIFEPYYTTKEPGKGTGLGLSVIHGIVKNHGGFITVDSIPGKGSAFHVYLPTLEDVEAEIEEAASAGKSGGSERILLVDDEPQIVAMEKQMLEKLGYRVTTQTSSTEALELFAAQPDQFDLVITDLIMPNKDGIGLIIELKKEFPDVKIVAMSGGGLNRPEGYLRGAQKLGATCTLSKPINRQELLRAVKDALKSESETPAA